MIQVTHIQISLKWDWCHSPLTSVTNGDDNDNDNENNFIAMNYIDHIIGDVQASSWIRNELVFVYIHLHSGIFSTLFSCIWHEKQNHNVLLSPTMQFLNSWQRGARSLGLWAPISVVMKQNIRRVQKNKENVQVQNTVCTVGTQQISIHFFLTALCSFRIRSVHQ